MLMETEGSLEVTGYKEGTKWGETEGGSTQPRGKSVGPNNMVESHTW